MNFLGLARVTQHRGINVETLCCLYVISIRNISRHSLLKVSRARETPLSLGSVDKFLLFFFFFFF